METNEATDLEAIESRLFQSTQDDGFLELQFGVMLLILGITAYIDDIGMLNYYYGYFLILVTPLIVILGRRYITEPRLGKVTFGAKRQLRLAGATMILSASVLLGLLVFVLAATNIIRIPEVVRPYVIPTIIALTIFLTLAALGHFMNNPRIVFIGAIFAGAELFIPILRLHTDLISPAGVALTGGGVFIIIMATWVLARFLKDHPKPDTLTEGRIA